MLALYLNMLDTPEEKDKFEYIYTHYRALMFHVANEVLEDEYAAEDAVQDTFLRIIRKIDYIEISDSKRLKRLIAIITQGVARDMWRQRRRMLETDYEEIAPTLSDTPDMLGNVAAEELVQLIAALPETYRVPLELKAYHGLNEKQIADLLDISHAAVRKRLQRARDSLSAALEKE